MIVEMTAMFGFIRLNPNHLQSHPAAARQETLVSSEDIYRFDLGLDPILLLRKGFELSPEELPRFLKSGAQLHQFHYKHSGQSLAKAPALAHGIHKRTGMGNSILATFKKPKKSTQVPYKQALIIEPDQKHLKRLIDCLFVCGVPLDQIHPVRVVSSVPWALEKYRPQILMANYELSNTINGLSLLQILADLSYVETLVLILPPHIALSTEEQTALQRINQKKRIKLLTRPVNRFDLQPLLDETSEWQQGRLHRKNEKPVA
jgi:hypothetical protein